ncbi:hypothetical protein CAOG_010106 [Capsaspora owczarzaki ATCC 30864]|uniref:Uncharacterized protein n=1 Tax=Capsaspora owczarzaki (strain ATCC 30864) TaxID=595528 RepID=A0A0D2UQN3_CAPO3|nr:hypothetical protein CAOG_010106 [Capsaspora owczarzaki ATCC 30864]
MGQFNGECSCFNQRPNPSMKEKRRRSCSRLSFYHCCYAMLCYAVPCAALRCVRLLFGISTATSTKKKAPNMVVELTDRHAVTKWEEQPATLNTSTQMNDVNNWTKSSNEGAAMRRSEGRGGARGRGNGGRNRRKARFGETLGL